MISTRLIPLAAIILCAGCNPGYCSANLDLAGSPDGPGAYPGAPYGSDVGSTIANLSIAGTQRDDNKNGTPSDDPLRTITLDDYRVDPGLRVLVILVAAEWCLPCQNEQKELVAEYQAYRNEKAGVAMLEAITQKANSSPADAETIANWATHYNVPFDMTFDPGAVLAPYSDPSTYPAQLVIRTSDMNIRWTHNGYEPGSLKDAIDSVLAK